MNFTSWQTFRARVKTLCSSCSNSPKLVMPARVEPSETISIPKRTRSPNPLKHESDAELLVRQYLGSDLIDSTPRSIDGSVFHAKLATQSTSNLARQLVKEEAAVRIQKSFRKFKDEVDLQQTSFGMHGDEAVELIKRYKQDGGQLMEDTFTKDIRLVLNFDVNKTIIMSDKVQGGDMAFMVNSLLAECAWGRLEPGPKWVPVGRLATDRPLNDPRLMTYNSYLDSFFLPYEIGRTPEIEAKNNEIKGKRRDLKRVFTIPGQPGEMFRGVYDKLCKELELPEWHRRDSPLFKKGLTNILPSFFNLLIHLQSQGRDFTIIFRTFGDDAPQICEEMNMFCTGQHPRYPNVKMDGRDGWTDLRLLSKDSLALYHRASAKDNGTVLYIGADLKAMSGKRVDKRELTARAEEGPGILLRGFKEIHDYYLEETKKHPRAFMIRDYYPFWKSRNERSNAGKLLLLDSSDKQTLKIFFDDNIGHTSAHIVDARDITSGEPVSFREVEGTHLFKVEPLNAILDPHYFIRATHECAVRWLENRQAEAKLHAYRNAGYRHIVTSRGMASGEDSIVETRALPIVNTSRRARELWSTLHTKILAVVRLQRVLQDLD